MLIHFTITRDDAMQAALKAFYLAYPAQYLLLNQIEMVPRYDDNHAFDGFLVSGEIEKQKKGV